MRDWKQAQRWTRIYNDLLLQGVDPDEARVMATDILEEQEIEDHEAKLRESVMEAYDYVW